MGIAPGPAATGKPRWRWLVCLAGGEERGASQARRSPPTHGWGRGQLCPLGVELCHPLWLPSVPGKSTEDAFVLKLLLRGTSVVVSPAGWGEVSDPERRANGLHSPCGLHFHRGLSCLEVQTDLVLYSSSYFMFASISRDCDDTNLSKIKRYLVVRMGNFSCSSGNPTEK